VMQRLGGCRSGSESVSGGSSDSSVSDWEGALVRSVSGRKGGEASRGIFPSPPISWSGSTCGGTVPLPPRGLTLAGRML